VFNQWKKVWMDGFFKKKHHSIIKEADRFEPALRGTPALGDSGSSRFGDI
jgi:hypothetical protein